MMEFVGFNEKMLNELGYVTDKYLIFVERICDKYEVEFECALFKIGTSILLGLFESSDINEIEGND